MTENNSSYCQEPNTDKVAIHSILTIFLGCSVGNAYADNASIDAVTARSVTEIRELANQATGALSNDGRQFAYAVRGCRPSTNQQKEGGRLGNSGLRAKNEGCTDLWVADTRTGRTQRITTDGLAEEPVWSPDNSKLAFYSAADGIARVYVWDRRTLELRKVSNEPVQPSFAEDTVRMKWTPDGKHLIVPLRPRDTDHYGSITQTKSRVTSFEEEPLSIAKTPGSTVRVFDATSPMIRATVEKGMEKALLRKESSPINREVSRLAEALMVDLAIVNVDSGDARRLSGKKPIIWFDVSPDGARVAYSLMSGFKTEMNMRTYDVEVVSTNGGAIKTLAKDVYPDQGICMWSPDSRKLVYIVELDLPVVADVHLIDVASGNHRDLTPEATTEAAIWKSKSTMYWALDNATLVFEASGRIWQIDTKNGKLLPISPADWNLEAVKLLGTTNNQIWSSDGGRSVTVMTRNPISKDMGFYRIDIVSGTPTKLLSEPKNYGHRKVGQPLVSANGSVLVFSAESAQQPMDFWAAGPDLNSMRQLTHINPQFTSAATGASRLIQYRGSDGQELQGALVLPANYQEGQRVPVVVKLYPSLGRADRVNWFNGEDQILASRGYAVLRPDVPIIVGAPMDSLTYHTSVAVNKLVDLGIADPERIGIWGESHGGYAAIAVVTQSNRYKAAVMSSGFADLISFYGELQESGTDSWISFFESDNGAMGGSPWQFRHRYIENSPVFYLDQVRTPVLIMHGTSDKAVPQAYANQVFSGLRRLSVPVEMRKYRGAGHVMRSKENFIDYWESVVRWYDTYLKKTFNDGGELGHP